MRYLKDWRDLEQGQWVTLYKSFYGQSVEEFASGADGSLIGRRQVRFEPDDSDIAVLRSWKGETYTEPVYRGKYQIDEDSISWEE